MSQPTRDQLARQVDDLQREVSRLRDKDATHVECLRLMLVASTAYDEVIQRMLSLGVEVPNR